MMHDLSPVAISNLFTMGATAKVDPKQKLPEQGYQIPPAETRELRARLIMEEAFETLKALGVVIELADDEQDNPIELVSGNEILFKEMKFTASDDPHRCGDFVPDLDGIIDGCADLDFVTIGTLMACGVPDVPHLHEVCRCNNLKFPGGVATTNNHGKFQKPPGWKAPDHAAVRAKLPYEPNLAEISRALILSSKSMPNGDIGRSSFVGNIQEKTSIPTSVVADSNPPVNPELK